MKRISTALVMMLAVLILLASCLESPAKMTALRLEPQKTYAMGDRFYIGDWKAFAVYSDGSELEINVVDLAISMKEGTPVYMTTTFMASYNGISTAVTFSPEGEPSSLSVLTMPYRTSYKEGEAISFDGLSFLVTESDGTVTTIQHDDPLLSYSISEGSSISSDTIVMATYDGRFSASFTLSVIVEEVVTLSGISVLNMPYQTRYSEDVSELSLEGLKLLLLYSDGTSSTLDYPSEGLAVTPAEGTAITEDTEITVSYGGFTDSFEVSYDKEASLSGISVLNMPSKTGYGTGDNILSYDGLRLLLLYSDGTTGILDYPAEGIEVTPAEGSVITDSMDVSVSYSGFSDSFTVSYEKETEESLMLMGYPNAIYTGEKVDLRLFTYLWQKKDGSVQVATISSVPGMSFIIEHNGSETPVSTGTFVPAEDGVYTVYPVLEGRTWKEASSSISYSVEERLLPSDVRVSFIDNLGDAFVLDGNPSVDLRDGNIVIRIPGLADSVSAEWTLDGSPVTAAREGDVFTYEGITPGRHVLTGLFAESGQTLGTGSISITVEIPNSVSIDPVV